MTARQSTSCDNGKVRSPNPTPRFIHVHEAQPQVHTVLIVYPISFTDEARYLGETQDNKPHGQGCYTYSRNDPRLSYEGAFFEGKPHGVGTIKFRSGAKFVGVLDNNQMIEGTFTNPDLSLLTIKNNKPWSGTYHKNGKIIKYENGVEKRECNCVIL